jgi:oxygen-independent coproporphyrinogen-3 oxidase
MGQVLGVYIHLPFCKSKCAYCDFYSLAACDSLMDDYQKALLTRFKTVAPRLKSYTVDSVYFGGGTPSYYGDERLRELLHAVRRYCTVSKTAEITVECNPDSVELRSLVRLRKAGVNRLSLGMQSADGGALAALGRVHNPAQTREAVALARAAKFDNLSLDLMFGLPGQTMDAWRETLEAALALDPEHLSGYGLKLESGTPLARLADRGELDKALPDEDLQADMYLYMVERLRQTGLRQYEISNFAKTGKESRHNLKYWMGRDYVGFGPGAHSFIGERRFHFARDLLRYIEHTRDGTLTAAESEQISKDERAREYILLRLRTLRGIEEWEFRREFTRNFDPFQRKLELFESRGFAEQAGHRWHFTPEGFLLSNRLIGELLDCFDEAE